VAGEKIAFSTDESSESSYVIIRNEAAAFFDSVGYSPDQQVRRLDKDRNNYEMIISFLELA
jgi:hypothetical protein